MDISIKSAGELIDQLITTNIKCWFAQEVVMHETDTTKVAEAAIKAQKLNAQRNELIRAINNIIDKEHYSPTEKSYK